MCAHVTRDVLLLISVVWSHEYQEGDYVVQITISVPQTCINVLKCKTKKMCINY